MPDESKIYELLKAGKSQVEIAKELGVTKQAVNEYIHNKKRVRRTRLALYGDIPYAGLRRFFLDTPGMSTGKFTAAMYGSPSHTNRQRVARLLHGVDIYVTVPQIKRIIAFTGKSFEELFAED